MRRPSDHPAFFRVVTSVKPLVGGAEGLMWQQHDDKVRSDFCQGSVKLTVPEILHRITYYFRLVLSELIPPRFFGHAIVYGPSYNEGVTQFFDKYKNVTNSISNQVKEIVLESVSFFAQGSTILPSRL